MANKIRKFRVGIEEQILATKREQLNTVSNLIVQYGKADMFEKGRIRRALELMGKPHFGHIVCPYCKKEFRIR